MSALTSSCEACRKEFSLLVRRHHCKVCGNAYCDHCCHKTLHIPEDAIVVVRGGAKRKNSNSNLSVPNTMKNVRVCMECWKVHKDGYRRNVERKIAGVTLAHAEAQSSDAKPAPTDASTARKANADDSSSSGLPPAQFGPSFVSAPGFIAFNNSADNSTEEETVDRDMLRRNNKRSTSSPLILGGSRSSNQEATKKQNAPPALPRKPPSFSAASAKKKSSAPSPPSKTSFAALPPDAPSKANRLHPPRVAAAKRPSPPPPNFPSNPKISSPASSRPKSAPSPKNAPSPRRGPPPPTMRPKHANHHQPPKIPPHKPRGGKQDAHSPEHANASATANDDATSKKENLRRSSSLNLADFSLFQTDDAAAPAQPELPSAT